MPYISDGGASEPQDPATKSWEWCYAVSHRDVKRKGVSPCCLSLKGVLVLLIKAALVGMFINKLIQTINYEWSKVGIVSYMSRILSHS